MTTSPTILRRVALLRRSVHTNNRRASGVLHLFLAALITIVSGHSGLVLADDAGEAPIRLAQVPKVLGCEILSMDIGKTKDCLEDAVGKEVRKAERAVRSTLETQVENAQKQAAALEKEVKQVQLQAKIEAAKADALFKGQLRNAEAQAQAAQRQVADLQRQIQQSALAAQLEWQRAIISELQKQQKLFECIAQSAGTNIQSEITSFSTDPGAFASQKVRMALTSVTATVPNALKTELDQIASGQGLSGDKTAMIRRGTDMMIRFSDPIPSARCLMQTITPQARQQLEAAVGGVLNDVEKQMKAVLDTHIVPAVKKGIAVGIGSGFQAVVRAVPSPVDRTGQQMASTVPFLDGLTLTDREMRAIARGVLLDMQYKKAFKDGAAVVEQLNGSLASGSADALIADAQKRVSDVLKATPNYDKLYASMGVELMRAVGHKYVDSEKMGHGGFLLNNGFALLQLSDGTLSKLVQALCGLIPEAGAAACGAYLMPIAAGWNVVIVPQLKSLTSKVIHDAFDGSMNNVRTELDKGRKLDEIRQSLGGADALIAALPSQALLSAWANGFVADDVKDYDRYANSIIALAGVAARRK